MMDQTLSLKPETYSQDSTKNKAASVLMKSRATEQQQHRCTFIYTESAGKHTEASTNLELAEKKRRWGRQQT